APLFVGAVIEVDHKDVQPLQSGRAHIKHIWGQANLALGDEYEWTIFAVDTVTQKFDVKKRQIKNNDPNRAELLLQLAEWSLEHGLQDRIPKLIDEVAKLDPKNATAIAFQRVQADIERGASPAENAADWQKRLGDY